MRFTIIFLALVSSSTSLKLPLFLQKKLPHLAALVLNVCVQTVVPLPAHGGNPWTTVHTWSTGGSVKAPSILTSHYWSLLPTFIHCRNADLPSSSTSKEQLCTSPLWWVIRWCSTRNTDQPREEATDRQRSHWGRYWSAITKTYFTKWIWQHTMMCPYLIFSILILLK